MCAIGRSRVIVCTAVGIVCSFDGEDVGAARLNVRWFRGLRMNEIMLRGNRQKDERRMPAARPADKECVAKKWLDIKTILWKGGFANQADI